MDQQPHNQHASDHESSNDEQNANQQQNQRHGIQDAQNQRHGIQDIPHLHRAPPPYNLIGPQLQPHNIQANILPRQMTPVQYIKNLPMFKHGSDLLIFLHRFQSYYQALRIPENMRASLLVAHLDDTALRGIARHLNENITHDEVIELLKNHRGTPPITPTTISPKWQPGKDYGQKRSWITLSIYLE